MNMRQNYRMSHFIISRFNTDVLPNKKNSTFRVNPTHWCEHPVPQNSVSRKIRILHKINKKNIFETEMSGFWKVCSFLWAQYLVGPPFAWIPASMQCDMAEISLWYCSGIIEAQDALIAAFRSSALLGLVSLIFLLTIPHIFSMGFRSGEFAGQSSTVIPLPLNQLLVLWAVWAGAKSCWKIKSASP